MTACRVCQHVPRVQGQGYQCLHERMCVLGCLREASGSKSDTVHEQVQDCGCMKKEWAYVCGPDLSYTNVTAE